MESCSDSSGPGETAVVLEKTAVVLEELLLFCNTKALPLDQHTFLMCFLKNQEHHLN